MQLKKLSKSKVSEIMGTSENKASVISFVIDGIHPHDIGTIMDNLGIAIRAGHHCTQPIMDFYNIPATARASFAIYNTKEDVDKLIEGIEKSKGSFYVTDFGDLYMEVILDHNKNPRNKGVKLRSILTMQTDITHLCGDKISLDLIIEDDIVKEIKFTGSGCAISTASSSILTEHIIGKKTDEIRHLFEEFHDLVTSDKSESKNLGKLSVFEGVKKYPARVKCATLAWHTLIAAIDGEEEVSTE